MTLISEVVLIMFFKWICVTCDPVMYPYGAETMHFENRYSPLAYRNVVPRDMYAASSRQRMYQEPPSSNYEYFIEEPNIERNSSTLNDFLHGGEELKIQLEGSRAAEYRPLNYFPDLRVSSSSKHNKLHHLKTGNGDTIKTGVVEYVEPYKGGQVENVEHIYSTTTASPTQNTALNVPALNWNFNSILQPANTNMDKWSGILQLVLGFLTESKSGNSELKGFLDIIITGLLKPILDAKSNIKSFVSKITIPLVSLLLINVEVLFTVWWLWEDCPKEMKIASMDHTSTDQRSVSNLTYT